MGKGDIAIRIVGVREMAGGCPEPLSRGHSLGLNNVQPVAHVPVLAHSNCTAFAHGHLNSNPLTILLDSGASCSVFSKDRL